MVDKHIVIYSELSTTKGICVVCRRPCGDRQCEECKEYLCEVHIKEHASCMIECANCHKKVGYYIRVFRSPMDSENVFIEHLCFQCVWQKGRPPEWGRNITIRSTSPSLAYFSEICSLPVKKIACDLSLLPMLPPGLTSPWCSQFQVVLRFQAVTGFHA